MLSLINVSRDVVLRMESSCLCLRVSVLGSTSDHLSLVMDIWTLSFVMATLVMRPTAMIRWPIWASCASMIWIVLDIIMVLRW